MRHIFIGCPRRGSTIDAVGNAAKQVFHFADAGVGVYLVQRATAAEGAVGGLQPGRRFLSAAQSFRGVGEDLRQTHGAVGFGRRQARVLRVSASEGVLRDADFLRDL